jgi:hypothetical protein
MCIIGSCMEEAAWRHRLMEVVIHSLQAYSPRHYRYLPGLYTWAILRIAPAAPPPTPRSSRHSLRRARAAADTRARGEERGAAQVR